MRVAFILPGLHRVVRGAEGAFESIARELAQMSDVEVTLFGSGEPRENEPYNFIHVPNVPRESFEHWPKFPVLRTEYAYEELTFVASLIKYYKPKDFDFVVTCSYPFINWLLRIGNKQHQPVHIYVTENGDWEIQGNRSEYRYFSCDGLVCINPEYYERNKDKWKSMLIPNGVNPDSFVPGPANRELFNLPEDVPLALIVSALISSKRVCEGIRAASKIDGLHLVVCGDGPERDQVKALGEELMPGRFKLMKLTRQQMPDMYRAADLLLHMSLDEPFGNIYIEASAIGLPVVAHDWKATRWILEDTAILVDTTSDKETIAGINKALKRRYQDSIELRRQLVEKRFAWKNIAKMYYEFFRSFDSNLLNEQQVIVS
ncbi:glycosyltransferase family 4 protein [Leptolyngbya cf. ectocarpi LEGE 11479]|uniref:Glycosyltransferase family 4 protein n=1 Tax=Leptolyngbya cf. ectocarpi LEGE 11479 TaxID=1828722 RepID=A0A929FBK2_LEPEC|nr:glycosyltransferase family 4 protein [Leptolyngbya ectocarpi]MBE9070821.1 glycosyltransferase family 4 protein [Leptolyngbya cf. ectocarpi LEGE 11479]